MGSTYEALLRAEKIFSGKAPHLQLEPVAKWLPSTPPEIAYQSVEIRRNPEIKQAPTIFIVDDEERMCRSLQAILAHSGYRVAYATSGKIALDTIHNGNIDLFLSDIHMPDLNGFELLEQVLSTLPKIPVIMMTGDATVASAVKALKMGAYDYLKKPFEPEVLIRTIENALDQKRLIEQKRILDNRLNISERRFRFMLQNTSDLVYTLDKAGRFKYVKDSVAKNFGYRSSDLVGQYYDSVVFKNDIPAARWRFNERRTGSRATSGHTIRLKPGPLHTSNISNGFNYSVELYATGVYRKGASNGETSQLGTYGVIRSIPQNGNHREDPTGDMSLDKTLLKVLGGIGHDLNDILSSTRSITTKLKNRLHNNTSHLENIGDIEINLKKSQNHARELLRFANRGNPKPQQKKKRSDCRKVTFRLKTPNAKQVYLVGDFNNWDSQATPLQKSRKSRWETTLVLPIGRYEFKYLVDGKWRENLKDEQIAPNKYGTFNHFVNVGETS